jgi:hypothetical protein
MIALENWLETSLCELVVDNTYCLVKDACTDCCQLLHRCYNAAAHIRRSADATSRPNIESSDNISFRYCAPSGGDIGTPVRIYSSLVRLSCVGAKSFGEGTFLAILLASSRGPFRSPLGDRGVLPICDVAI